MTKTKQQELKMLLKSVGFLSDGHNLIVCQAFILECCCCRTMSLIFCVDTTGQKLILRGIVCGSVNLFPFSFLSPYRNKNKNLNSFSAPAPQRTTYKRSCGEVLLLFF